MKIITGSTGTTHVTSNNDGEFNQSIYGPGLVILQNGGKLGARVVDNNTIEISDGDIVFQGRHALIEPGVKENISIDTGAVGVNRIDLIVAHYEMDSVTGYETLTLKVIKGSESAGTAQVPAITEGVIRTGAAVAEAVLYQVNINGISIASVDRKAEIVNVIKEDIESAISGVNSVTSKVNNAFAMISGTLTAGQTELVLSNSRIKADSIVDSYFWAAAGAEMEPVSYNTIKVEAGKVTMTFDALESNLNVGIRII